MNPQSSGSDINTKPSSTTPDTLPGLLALKASGWAAAEREGRDYCCSQSPLSGLTSHHMLCSWVRMLGSDAAYLWNCAVSLDIPDTSIRCFTLWEQLLPSVDILFEFGKVPV